MAAARSRLHTLFQSCARCSRSRVGNCTILDKQRDVARKTHHVLPHRLLWSTGQPTCRSSLYFHHHQHRWQPAATKKAMLLMASSSSSSLTSTRHRGYHISASLLSSPLQSSTPSQDAYALVQGEMESLCDSIRHELRVDRGDLGTMVRYYFDGTGKAFRPMVVMLMAKACNSHHREDHTLLSSQKKIAMITEMLHTATLIHDDVIDASDARRGKDSVNSLWGQRKAILSGNYILSVVSSILAGIGNADVVCIMSQVVEDLVRGEFMQLGSKEKENERFAHYLDKTFKKTASMLAASCQSVAVLGGCHDDVCHMAFQYGRNLGIAFQLVDDLLDFVSSEQQLGKPAAADLKLGLATAPVLFAAQEFPELSPMIMRRFSQEGDVETARQLVAKSDGMEQTKLLAAKHTQEAVRLLRHLTSSNMRDALVNLTQTLLTRNK